MNTIGRLDTFASTEDVSSRALATAARSALLPLAFLAGLGALVGCAHQAPAVATPASEVAFHPVVGFAMAKGAAPGDTRSERSEHAEHPERIEEPRPIVDAIHGWSHSSPR